MPTFTLACDCDALPGAAFRYIETLANWSRFRGFGPLPGIAEASLPAGEEVGLGARIFVRNTDGSAHAEVVTAHEPPSRFAVRMEVAPPASAVFSWIDEEVRIEARGGGSRIVRRFVTRARAWWTWPLAWLVTHVLLRPAVRRHNRDVARDLSGPPATR